MGPFWLLSQGPIKTQRTLKATPDQLPKWVLSRRPNKSQIKTHVDYHLKAQATNKLTDSQVNPESQVNLYSQVKTDS